MTRKLVLLAIALATLVLAPSAWSHAHVQPTAVLAKEDNVFAVTVPTEEDGTETTTVELAPPEGFSIDAFAPTPGWRRTVETTGSGASTQISKVTWSGGAVPTGQSAFFVFTGEAESSGPLKFDVRQTYANGEVVDWSGSESSETPAPVVEAKSSLGGGTSTLALVALIVGALGVLLGGLALLTRGTRRLA